MGSTNPEIFMSNLRVRQELSAPTGLQGLEATTHPVDNNFKERVRFAKIIHVRNHLEPRKQSLRELGKSMIRRPLRCFYDVLNLNLWTTLMTLFML